MSPLHDQLQDVFREIFDDETLVVTDSTTADDIDGWDSVAHVSLIFAVEERFGVRLPDDQIGDVADVGALKAALRERGAAT